MQELKMSQKIKSALIDFSRVGYITALYVSEKQHLSNNDVQLLLQANLIERCTLFQTKNKANETVYRLTKHAKKVIKKQLGLTSFYQRTSGLHDLNLSSFYFSLPEEVRSSWMNGYELFKFLTKEDSDVKSEDIINGKYHFGFPKTLDAAYIDEKGNLVGIEIVTQNYSSKQLKAKKDFSKKWSIPTKFINATEFL